jgi:hypothetical protein
VAVATLPALTTTCPDTERILCDAGFVVHPHVTERAELAALLRAVLNTTLENWQGAIEANLATAYDRQGCGLSCFEQPAWDAVEN